MAIEAISEISSLTRTESKPNIDRYSVEGMLTPVIARSTPIPPPMQINDVIALLQLAKGKAPEKFFIMKSLTLEDLEASVRTGT